MFISRPLISRRATLLELAVSLALRKVDSAALVDQTAELALARMEPPALRGQETQPVVKARPPTPSP
jgi:hypothetical protein